MLRAIEKEPVASGAQLARACHVTPQSAQGLLKSLEVGELVVRTKDTVNDRILIAKLTPSGEQLLETAEKLARVIEKKVWQGVSIEKVTALNEVLAQCMGNLEGDTQS